MRRAGLTSSFQQSYALKIDQTKKRSSELAVFLYLHIYSWGEQDSNLRSSHSRFTVCPRWPLEYLPSGLFAVSGCKYKNCLQVSKGYLHLILGLVTMHWY
jgi:hypothetical protein